MDVKKVKKVKSVKKVKKVKKVKLSLYIALPGRKEKKWKTRKKAWKTPPEQTGVFFVVPNWFLRKADRVSAAKTAGTICRNTNSPIERFIAQR